MGLDQDQNEDKRKRPHVVWNYIDDRVCNAVYHLDQYRWGPTRDKLSHLYASRQSVILRQLSNFGAGDVVAKFQRRITALEWHPKVPYLVTAACKGGGIAYGTGHRNPYGEINFDLHKVQEGSGPGGAIFSLKYNTTETDWLYTASLDGKVTRMNLFHPEKHQFIYYDTEDWNHWFTAMDVSCQNKALLACTNKGLFLVPNLGFAHVYHLDGDKSSVIKLHRSKIHHCEFNKSIPYLIATASLDPKDQVCLWDLRNLKPDQPIFKYSGKGANVATFNPTDGSRLLMNDQKDQIRVLHAPMWDETYTIYHPHRQFQHLTAIEASWHPLHDIIVVGTYPRDQPGAGKKDVPLRPIDFFDGRTGSNIHRLYHPINGIISLNQFNPTGEVLASGMGCNLILWQASPHLEILEGNTKGAIQRNKGDLLKPSKSTRDALRGVGRKTGALDDDDDDDDFYDMGKSEPSKKRQRIGSPVSSSAKKYKREGSEKNPVLNMGSKSKPKNSTSCHKPKPGTSSTKTSSSLCNERNTDTKAKSSPTVPTPSSSKSKPGLSPVSPARHTRSKEIISTKIAAAGAGKSNLALSSTKLASRSRSNTQYKRKKSPVLSDESESEAEELPSKNRTVKTSRTRTKSPTPTTPANHGRGKKRK